MMIKPLYVHHLCVFASIETIRGLIMFLVLFEFMSMIIFFFCIINSLIFLYNQFKSSLLYIYDIPASADQEISD